jgi:RND superfamily putative drug exporter
MIYIIPLFIFVILVALGADYNIFLVSRIREEAQSLPIREAVSQSVANTGGVITACGVILAGTFATLMTSPLQVVFQIGAAVATGILLDTFLVRALLVPALAALAGRWSWWPSRLSRKIEKEK